MPRVSYMIPQQGFRPKTNPVGALAGLRGIGVRGLGLGASSAPPPTCLDQSENAVNCQDPECTYGDCGAVSPATSYTALQTGSNAIFQSALPWIGAVVVILVARNIGGRRK